MNDMVYYVLVAFGSLFLFFIPSIIWFSALVKLEKRVKNSFLRILLVSLSGLLVIMFVILLSKLFFPEFLLNITIILQNIAFLWLFLTYSQFNLQIIGKILRKNKQGAVILLNLLFLIGLWIVFYYLSFTSEFRGLIFWGIIISVRSIWFIFMHLFERIITGEWPAYKINNLKSNFIVSIDFRMTFFSAIFNSLSDIVWKPKLERLLWVTMISVTIVELVWFFVYGSDIMNSLNQIYSYEQAMLIFFPMIVVMNIIHEWGHLIGAKANNGFGVYKEKLVGFVPIDAVGIPMLLFTPKQRIKIALMGTCWPNLLVFIPGLILIITFFYYPLIFGSVFGLIISAMGFYAVISTLFFIFSLWPGGDMNNVLRDIYLTITGKDNVSTSIFGGEEETSYILTSSFKFDQEKTYTLSTLPLLRPISEEAYYVLDEKKFTTFLINESGYSVIQVIINTTFWKLEEIISEIKAKYTIPDNRLPEVKEDITEFLTGLGQRGYLEEYSEVLQK